MCTIIHAYIEDFLDRITIKVVVVTVNYRLGPWGELSLDSGRISGNQGLRDQVQVHEFISRVDSGEYKKTLKKEPPS